PDEGTRKFTSILKAAQAHWGEFFYDNSKKIARGVLATNGRATRIGELSYNDVKEHIYLTVRLNPGHPFASNQIQALQRFDNNLTSLGHVAWDEEDKIINVRASSVVPKMAIRHAVKSVFSETFVLLDNDNFQQFLA
ncbi:hypothetical protein ACFL6U_23395, partial [Planctomycetota bacterium]